MSNLFDQILEIHELLSGAGLEKTALEELKPQINEIASFLKIEHDEALILAVALPVADGNYLKIADLQLFLGVNQSEFMPYYAALDSLIHRELVEAREHQVAPVARKVMSKSPNMHIHIPFNVADALKTGDLCHLAQPQVKSLGPFLQIFNKYYRDRKKRFITLSTLFKRVSKLCAGQQIKVVKLLNRQKLECMEMVFLLRMIQEFVVIETTGDNDQFLDDMLGDHPDLQIEWRARFRFEKGTLFTKGLIELSDSFDGYSICGKHYNLSKPVIASLPFYDSKESVFQSSLMRVTQPEKIRPVSLQFEPGLRKQFSILRQTFEPEQFNRLQNRLSEQKMHKGLTILLYGASGTGKTESAYQLARESGRVILEADASEIKGAFVGESEKAMRKLFAEYRKARKVLPQTPILFFNEADGLLQNRRKVLMGVDAHDNSLQNLLLQELEEFDGIFIATTNLISNIDEAFDRRFLYKIEYKQPGLETRTEILLEKFNRLDPIWLKKIAASHKVTGAQIENVHRKLTIESVLQEDFVPTYECLDTMFAQESMRKNDQKQNTVIGFKSALNNRSV